MIGRLTGEAAECTPDHVLLDVSGVGYILRIPLSTYYRIVHAPESISLHVHTHVREDVLQLYGFFTVEERTLFQQLISISGVGPRIALAILSGIGAGELRSAVEQDDRARLQKIPGVGKKTAERLLLELRDKISRRRGTTTAAGEVPEPGQAEDESVQADAVSALVNLGYTRDQAERSVRTAIDKLDPAKGEATLEQVLKATLSRLVR